MVGPSLEAAEILSQLRTLLPCDWATVLRSVVKTGTFITPSSTCKASKGARP
ncbi:MAG: hypothetical protein V1689_14650 [Pseudomonadota bacterium]